MKQESHKTTCSYCGVGCGIIVNKDGRDRLSIEGDSDHPVNKGMLCSKGMTLHHVATDTSDRLLHPQMRWSRDHALSKVSWDTALDRAAAVFKSIIKKHGPDSVALYVSGQCTTEEYYLANKLTKGFLGTNNIDTNSRLCMSSAVVGYKKVFGEDSVPISYEDIELADCFMITGANPAWCHPIIFRRLEKHKENNPEVKVIVIDPRRTQTCVIADLHLQLNPGTDILLYHAISKVLIEKGAVDRNFIESFTNGYPAVNAAILKTSLASASEICGVAIEDIHTAAEYIGNAYNFISMWAMGLNQSSVGVDKNIALLNIHLLTGQVGKPGSGPFSLTGQPNAMGGREVGGMANLLAAHRRLDNERHRKEVARFWGVEKINSKPGLTATEMFEQLESGNLKAIWIICTNPMVSLPDLNRMEKALLKSKFVIVQDISNRSDTLAFADLILPAAGWLEKAGTMTNSERRISYLPKVMDPPGEAKPDAEILWLFAGKMGYHGFQYTDVAEVYDEYARLTKGTNIDISGLSHQRLIEEGSFQWPVPHIDHPGTARLFNDRNFYTQDAKAVFHIPKQVKHQSEASNTEYPLILTTGRIRDQWHTMTRTGKVNKLKRHTPKPLLEIAATDAEALKIEDGQIVVITSRRGSVRVKAKVSSSIKKGVVFLPMHWGKVLNDDFSRTNNLTYNLLDPQSKQPDFKYAAVQVKAYDKPVEKICLIGAGAAAFSFIERYRKLNTKDEIHVFSKEANPFYNRVLLPEYISDHLTWEQLQKHKEDFLEKLNINIYTNCSILNIDKQSKSIKDENGNSHSYDRLILATGSRPFIPAQVPITLDGVFTIRTKEDADSLKLYLKNNEPIPSERHVVIVGGGLLGLEVAAALSLVDVRVSIIQRGSRLMERQLDVLSSQLLAEDVRERNINIYFDNEVSTVLQEGTTGKVSINLKSGMTINCTAIVYAIGTRPNIEIAVEAGLEVKRGVVVDDYLQTTDPSIYAIGEIAEHQHKLYGITAAAEKQAKSLAAYLSGDKNSYFSGSILMNILKFENLDLCSIGQIHMPESDSNYEEIIIQDVSQRYYKRCIIKHDRMIGAVLMGDRSEFSEFKKLIEEGIELSELRTELLRSTAHKEPPIGPIVCSCQYVGKGNIKNAIRNNCHSYEQIAEKTMAGTACGSCRPEVKEILQKELQLLQTQLKIIPQVKPEITKLVNKKKRFWNIPFRSKTSAE